MPWTKTKKPSRARKRSARTTHKESTARNQLIDVLDLEPAEEALSSEKSTEKIKAKPFSLAERAGFRFGQAGRRFLQPIIVRARARLRPRVDINVVQPWYERNLLSVLVGLAMLGLLAVYIGGVFETVPSVPGPPIKAVGKPSNPVQRLATFGGSPARGADAQQGNSSSAPVSRGDAQGERERRFQPEKTSEAAKSSKSARSHRVSAKQTSYQGQIDNRTMKLPTPSAKLLVNHRKPISRAATAAFFIGIGQAVAWTDNGGEFGFVTLLAPIPRKPRCYDGKITRNDISPIVVEITEFCFRNREGVPTARP